MLLLFRNKSDKKKKNKLQRDAIKRWYLEILDFPFLFSGRKLGTIRMNVSVVCVH